MDLEEKTLETLQERCEECGTRLTQGEIAAALDSGKPFLCTPCAAEQVDLEDEAEEES